MGSKSNKEFVELEIFAQFAKAAHLPVDRNTIQKIELESEPDIFCAVGGEELAFELVEICDQDIAWQIAKLRRSGGVAVSSTADPTAAMLLKKMAKQYKSSRAIELVCYTNGRTISPDDQILANIRKVVSNQVSPFRKIWLLGEKGLYAAWPPVGS